MLVFRTMNSKWWKACPSALHRFRQAVENPRWGTPGVVNFVCARTKWIDGAVRAALDEGFEQVVAIAAGFDTRALRFGGASRGVTFFELDLPDASERKQELVEELFQPPERYPRPQYVAADLSGTSLAAALSATTFDPRKRTLFTVEGLLYYLPHSAVLALFADIADLSAPGSRMVFDYLHAGVLSCGLSSQGANVPPGWTVTARSVAAKGEPFLSGLPQHAVGVEAFLASIPATPGNAEKLELRSGGDEGGGSPAHSVVVDAEAPAADTPGEAVAGGGGDAAPSPAAAAAAEGLCGGADGAQAQAGLKAVGGATAAAPAAAAQPAFRLKELLSPRQMAARELPHEAWDDRRPPILSFFSFALLERQQT